MIDPVLKNEVFLADVRAAGAPSNKDAFHLWWLGQSGFLLQWRGTHVLLDPYLSDSLTRKYSATDKPHVRMTARVVDPARLTFIDVVTSSHAHTDHLDPETLGPVLAASPHAHLVVPAAALATARERVPAGFSRLSTMDDGQSRALGPLKITGIAAAHETLERDETGRCKFLGYVLELGRWRLYHSGDCVVYDGLAERLRDYRIQVALLPINGRSPERRVAGNMTGPDAVALAQSARIGCVIPCHYDMFAFNTVSPEEFARAAERVGQPYKILRSGERYTTVLDAEGTADDG